jgi:hypothetical protein
LLDVGGPLLLFELVVSEGVEGTTQGFLARVTASVVAVCDLLFLMVPKPTIDLGFPTVGQIVIQPVTVNPISTKAWSIANA